MLCRFRFSVILSHLENHLRLRNTLYILSATEAPSIWVIPIMLQRLQICRFANIDRSVFRTIAYYTEDAWRGARLNKFLWYKMTISYQRDVASSTAGGFTRLLFKWKGSLYKLIYRELLLFLSAYILLSLVYRQLLNRHQRG